MQFSLNTAQLNSLLHSFITIYIKPHLKQEIKQVQQLLKKNTITQTYQYLNSLCKKNDTNIQKNNREKQVEIRHGPILKKTYTIQQIDIDTINSNPNRSISAEKTPYARKQNNINQKQFDNKSVDFHKNKRQHIYQQSSKNYINVSKPNIQNNLNHHQNLILHPNNQNHAKINQIVKKLKLLFNENQNKIQSFHIMSLPKRQEHHNNLSQTNIENIEKDPFKKFAVHTEK